MPSEHQGGSNRNRERFDDPHADEAARWLDQELIGYSDRVRMIEGLIRGIENLDRCRAWLDVERSLGRAGGSGRSAVLDMLEQREATILEHGERRERMPYGPRRPCDCCSIEDIREAAAAARESAQKRWNPAGTVGQTTSTGNRAANAGEASSLADFSEAVATDGGEPRDD